MQQLRHEKLDTQSRPRILKLAYDAGYGDAVVLLRPRSTDCESAEPIERVQARYLSNLASAHQTEETLAYLSGFGDAAADNLPCPLHAIRPEDHKNAA